MGSSFINQKVTEINIAGGEPTLCPYTIELSKYIRCKGVGVSLIIAYLIMFFQ